MSYGGRVPLRYGLRGTQSCFVVSYAGYMETGRPRPVRAAYGRTSISKTY
jgi:hypothetical protein